MIRTWIFVCLLAASPAFAQSGPSFDCAKANSSAEKLVCRDAELARLDRLVSGRYQAALKSVRGLGTGAKNAEARLRAYQRGWIRDRDDCWKAQDRRECVKLSYLQREGQLVARWMLEKPKSIAFWRCGGNQANEVVTYFYDTTLPSVRFERGDTIDTGSLARTGSGSKYDGSFGRFIWIKGKQATYREPDPDGTSFQCVLARQQ